ncbi:MAG: hypothetical protein ABH882_05060 [Candidatus Omnitrophota bacterium]|nr:hypothetical protein [Candidatus Omnitrophota bacterium]MBU1928462.1 hypothetical protein [Candidatus Omnitrophota bacterium]MBU2035465.1 hypothetical protein [Candidatus Omnitrophota bacterium]
MSAKKKFNPAITRIKLNPEQAILVCPCYNTGYMAGNSAPKQNICEGTTPATKVVLSSQKWSSGGQYS